VPRPQVLYPAAEQRELVKHLPNAIYKVLRSDEGHDGFLLEQEKISKLINDFLRVHDGQSSTRVRAAL